MTRIFEDVLRALLIQSNLVDSRVYLMRAPQTPTVPYMVFDPTGPEPVHTQDGPSDLLNRNYQVAIYDTSQSRALAIADGLREYLDGYVGYFQGVDFGSILFRLQSTQYEADTKLFQIVTEYRMRFRIIDLSTAVTTNKPAVTTAVTTKG